MNITIRPATINDLLIIHEFVSLLSDQQFDFQDFTMCFEECINNDNNYYLLAETDDRVVGYLSCHGQFILHHCGMVYEIQEMYVSEECRNQGVGAQLLRQLEEIIGAEYYELLEVSSNMRRSDAHRFYLANGFELTTYKFKKVPIIDFDAE